MTKNKIGFILHSGSGSSRRKKRKDKFEQFAACLIHEYDHIFYVSPLGVNIEDNGVRETNVKYRKEIDQTIQHYLNKYGYRIKNVTLISGPTEERIERVKQAIFPSYL